MPDNQTNTLARLHAEIETRVTAIRRDYPDWLCRMGCDGCCRRLAEIPSLTAQEWNWLREGLSSMPPESLHDISQAIAALSVQTSRPIICPLLDKTAGACRVYEHRPVACRTYGFYVQRDKGLYCKEIEAHVAEGAWPDAVWGNHDAVDRQLGEARDLTTWFAAWQTDW